MDALRTTQIFHPEVEAMPFGGKSALMRWPGWMVLAALAATGCGGKKPPPPIGGADASTAQAAAGAGTLAVEQTEVADTYIYSPVGKRDPFRSAYKEASDESRQSDVPRTPLQRFEIDQMKLIAVITGISQPRAMVTTPDGKGYTVKIGTRIGKNLGRVVRIKTGELIIAEDYRDWNGRKVTNYIHLALPKDEKK